MNQEVNPRSIPRPEKGAHPSLIISLIPVCFLVICLIFNVNLYQDNASYGPNQIALFLSGILVLALGKWNLKLDYDHLEKITVKSVSIGLGPIYILLAVGMLIGLWIMAGIVPSMIYYGIKMIHPSVFLPVTLIICSIVSLATGSSWSTVGTVGIALMGIGQGLGINEGMVGGAIVSGSYFGDKMSPLSETTNLAPAMAGVDLFDHIKHMTYTTVPAYVISLILFIVLGFTGSGDAIDREAIDTLLMLMDKNFVISPLLFIVPAVVVFLVLKKVPALPALIIGSLLSALTIVLVQGDLLAGKGAYEQLINVAYEGFKMESGNATIDKLFSRGGMGSMMNTVWIILTAMFFGGTLEATGMLETIAHTILKAVSSVTSLVTATVGSGLFLNLTTSDQYISIVLTGRMFKDAFHKNNLQPVNLSRTVEDSSTVTSVLVPWNSCGAYFSAIMGVATLSYLPFAFFNLLTPIMSIVVTKLGFGVKYIEEAN